MFHALYVKLNTAAKVTRTSQENIFRGRLHGQNRTGLLIYGAPNATTYGYHYSGDKLLLEASIYIRIRDKYITLLENLLFR